MIFCNITKFKILFIGFNSSIRGDFGEKIVLFFVVLFSLILELLKIDKLSVILFVFSTRVEL